MMSLKCLSKKPAADNRFILIIHFPEINLELRNNCRFLELNKNLHNKRNYKKLKAHRTNTNLSTTEYKN